jgi:hypothetical protein
VQTFADDGAHVIAARGRHRGWPQARPLCWQQPQPPSVLMSSQTHDRETAAPRITGFPHRGEGLPDDKDGEKSPRGVSGHNRSEPLCGSLEEPDGAG